MYVALSNVLNIFKRLFKINSVDPCSFLFAHGIIHNYLQYLVFGYQNMKYNFTYVHIPQFIATLHSKQLKQLTVFVHSVAS